ncbi:MAG: threonylcarbamoyl-AMP synthase [Chitinophagales bacterium]|nr:threonylcarbamoyl-AMP synthase [Chitinophagales bacterium]
MAEIGSNIEIAADWLKKGNVVSIPTETVYGLAANALNETAVLQIFDIKKRPSFDPLIVHISSINEIEKYTLSFPEVLKPLAALYMPGPLTLLLPKQSIIPDLVTSGLEQVAIRIPKHPLTLELLSSLDFPLAAPSANPFGYISPTSAAHVNQQLGKQIPYILDGGDCSIGIESTIIGIENDKIILYRLGGLSLNAIEAVVGKVQVNINQSSNPKSPGQIKSHYAPKKPFYIGAIQDLIFQFKDKKIGIISFGKKANFKQENIVEYNLSLEGDTYEAAQNLFSTMRILDNSDIDLIITDYLPETGLGLAINDRLQRAAAK